MNELIITITNIGDIMKISDIDAIEVMERQGYSLDVVVDQHEGIFPIMDDCDACGSTKSIISGIKPDDSKISICTSCGRISNK